MDLFLLALYLTYLIFAVELQPLYIAPFYLRPYSRATIGTLLIFAFLLGGATIASAAQSSSDITPGKSPFTFAPLSDFADLGVATSYKVVGVYPSEDVLYRLKYCESRVFDAYKTIPKVQREQLHAIKFLWYSDSARGLGGNGTIYLKCNDMTDDVLTSVFVHEMGHIVDTGLYDGKAAAGLSVYNDSRATVFKNDPSINFYSISWKDTTHVASGSTAFDFVTQYARSNPFEDFAESYNFYLLHGSQFKFMTKTNARLSRKYAYLRDHVFHGKEYTNNDIKLNARKRSYDATVLPFSLEKFLNNV